MKIQKQSGFAHLMIVTILLAIGLVGAVGYVAWDKLVNERQKASNVQEDADSSNSNNGQDVADKEVDPYGGWKTYKTSVSNLSFKYPASWVVGEEVANEYNASYRSIDVKNNGEKMATLIYGLDGLGGTCGDNEQPTYSVLDTETTSIKAVKQVNFSFIVLPSETGYTASYGLTDSYTSIESGKSCLIYMLFESTLENSQSDRKKISFSNGFSGGDKKFNTLDDAKEYLNSDEYKNIKKMVMSLSY